MNTCSTCRFFELPAAEDVARLELQGYVVPRNTGHCQWTPPEPMVFPEAFTLQIRPMAGDEEHDCPRHLELEEEPSPEGGPGKPRVLMFKKKSDVEDLVS